MQQIKAIEQQIAKAVAGETGCLVDITNRAAGKWTISGEPASVDAAVDYMTRHRLMTLNERAHDDEIGETFAYLSDV